MKSNKFHTNKISGQMSFVEPQTFLFDVNTPSAKDFLKFHHRNPEVYETFRRDALREIQAGREHSSIQLHTEESRQDFNYRLNNNHSAYYSRLFLQEFPEYLGFFETRKLKNER